MGSSLAGSPSAAVPAGRIEQGVPKVWHLYAGGEARLHSESGDAIRGVQIFCAVALVLRESDLCVTCDTS